MKVLLTRRLEDGQRSAERYREAGFDVKLLPLFERRTISTAMPKQTFDFSIFTSSAAVEVLSEEAHAVLRPQPAYAVGPKVVESLNERAYKNVRLGKGVAADLANMIIADLSNGGLLRSRSTGPVHGLYPCGKVRSFDFPAAFSAADAAAGIQLLEWEVYETLGLDPGAEAFLSAVNTDQTLLIPLYSPASATHFFKLVERYRAEKTVARHKFIAIAHRCADQIPPALQERLHIAERPDEGGVLEIAKKLA